MSGVFTLDKKGADRVEEQAALNLLDVSQQAPLFWDDAGEATAKGVVQGLGVGYMMVGTTGALIEDTVRGSGTEARDAHFRRLDTFIDDWTPDPHTTGTAGQVGNGLAKILPPLLLARGNPTATAFGTTAVTVADTGLPLVKQGVDANTAGAVAAVQGLTNLVGMKVPTLGVTRLQRVASGAVGNVAVETPAGLASADILDGSGYDAQAEQFAPTSESTMIAGLVGAAFGLPGGGPRLSPSERAAVATLNNADHFTERTMPGVPKSHEAAMAHQDNIGASITQVLNGEPVAVPHDNLDQFLLRPELRPAANDAAEAAPAAGNYDAMLVALESGGRADAKAATSSATGLHQFTDGTWLNTVRTAQPAWAAGVDEAQLLAMRTDPAKSTEMEAALRAENAAALTNAGQEASPFNLYAAHHFGSGKGVAFAKAGPDMPMSAILTKGQIAANPYLKGLTKAEAIANWTRRAERAGVKIDGKPIADENIVNPIDETATPEAKLAQLQKLTDENEPTVTAFLAELDAELGTVSKSSRKSADAIMGKASRPSILAEKPWHGIEHVRDTFRFKTVIDSVDQLPKIAERIAAKGWEVVKVDTDKMLTPKAWGWRFAALDLRMPNGQLVEFYMPLKGMEAQKKINHVPFERWRNADPQKMTAEEKTAMAADMKASRESYDAAFAADVAGMDESALRASLTSFAASASSVTGSRSDSSPTVKPLAPQAPRARTDEKAPSTIQTSSRPGDATTIGLSDMGVSSDASIPGNGAKAQATLVARAAADTVAAYPDLVVMGEDGVARPASEVLAEAAAQQAQAEETVRAIEAAASCFMRTAA